jgi:subtilisin-like proprotein convertase family protein
MYSRAALLGVLSLLIVGTAAAVPNDVTFTRNGQTITGLQVSAFVGDNVIGRFGATEDGIYSVDAEVGQKVFFQLTSLAGKTFVAEGMMTGGVVTIEVPVPSTPNDAMQTDACQDYPLGEILPGVTTGTTIGATTDFGFPSPCGTASITSPGVWYTFLGTGNDTVLSMCENSSNGFADFDTKLSVFCPDCAEPICVDGNDDEAGCNFHSTVGPFGTEAGATYLVLVHGFGGAVGNFGLDYIDTGVPSASAVACLPPPPVGACCDCNAPPFNCVETTEDECAARGGQYSGDDSECFTIVQPRFESAPGIAFGGAAGQPSFIQDTVLIDCAAWPDIITDVNIELQISHTWIGDLSIDITHDDTGTSQNIWDNRCGSTQNINATADDEGTETLCSVVAAGPANQTFYSPAVAALGPLNVFDGEPLCGSWTLSILDTFPSLDDGTLNAWAVTLDPTDIISNCPDQNNALCFLCDGGGLGDDDDDDYAGGGGNVSNLDLSSESVDAGSSNESFQFDTHAGDSTRRVRDQEDSRKLDRR